MPESPAGDAWQDEVCVAVDRSRRGLPGGYENGDDSLFGPLPGRRLGNAVAYEMCAPDNFDTWPSRDRVERTFVPLDVGVSFANACWSRVTHADGTSWAHPDSEADTWYVDLVTVAEEQQGRLILRDLFVDVLLNVCARDTPNIHQQRPWQE